jgi:hypothetical protein
MAATTNDSINRLRHIAALLPAEDAAWVSSAVDAAIAGAPLEAALGLRPGWRATHRMREQEALICELVARFGPMTPAAIASKIARFVCGAQNWRPGSAEELLHYVARTGGRPPSSRTVRRRLEACHSVPFVGKPAAPSSAS